MEIMRGWGLGEIACYVVLHTRTHTLSDMQRSLSPPPDPHKPLTVEIPVVTSHAPLSAGHMTQHSSLYMKHVTSSTQFNREQLHYLFNVAHEMKMTVCRSGSTDLLKVAEDYPYSPSHSLSFSLSLSLSLPPSLPPPPPPPLPCRARFWAPCSTR